MCHVDLQGLKPGLEASAGRLDEIGGGSLNLGRGKLPRKGRSAVERDRTGSYGLPTAIFRRQGVPTPPGRIGGGFAAGMGQLDTGNRSLGPDKGSDPAKSRNRLIRPYPEVPRRNPPLRGDRSRFGKHQTGPAHRPAAEMNEMPVSWQAALTAVLAHGGDKDPVFEFDLAQSQRGE